MSDNRGKTIEDCVVEREAEYAWLKHLTDPADIKRCRQRITHLGNRIQKLNEKAREGTDHPQEAATPSDPHSAEALAQAFHENYERLAPSFGYETRNDSAVEWADVPEPNKSLMIAVAAALIEQGRVSRDAEVAELKAKIAGLEVWPAHDHVWDFNGRCLGCASWEKCPEFGSASSPVEGGN